MTVENSGEITNNCMCCCLDFVDSDGIIVTPCNHVFHDECLRLWFRTRCSSNIIGSRRVLTPDCPACRREFQVSGDGGSRSLEPQSSTATASQPQPPA